MYKNNYKERLAKKKKYEKLASEHAIIRDIFCDVSDIVDTVEANKVKIEICEKVINQLISDRNKRYDLYLKKWDRLSVSSDKSCELALKDLNGKDGLSTTSSKHLSSMYAAGYEKWLHNFGYHGYHRATGQMCWMCKKIRKVCHQNVVSSETKSLKRPLTRYEKASIEDYMLSIIYDIFRDMDETYFTLSDEEYDKHVLPRFSKKGDYWASWQTSDSGSYFCYDALKAIIRIASFHAKDMANWGAHDAFETAKQRIDALLDKPCAIIVEKCKKECDSYV